MKLFLLGGNSKSNKDWIREVHANLKTHYDEAEILYYDHWEMEDNDEIDLDLEMAKLVELVKDCDEYMIFAKSAGTLVTLKAIHQKKLNPRKIIFVGLPVNWGKEKGYEFEEWLKSLTHPATFIQKKSDPQMSFMELK